MLASSRDRVAGRKWEDVKRTACADVQILDHQSTADRPRDLSRGEGRQVQWRSQVNPWCLASGRKSQKRVHLPVRSSAEYDTPERVQEVQGQTLTSRRYGVSKEAANTSGQRALAEAGSSVAQHGPKREPGRDMDA